MCTTRLMLMPILWTTFNDLLEVPDQLFFVGSVGGSRIIVHLGFVFLFWKIEL